MIYFLFLIGYCHGSTLLYKMLKYTVLSQILNVLLVYGNINIRYPSRSDYQQVDNMTQYITNETQHNITAAQLLYCPLEPMCHNLTRMQTYAKNVEPYFMNCCKGCSCSVDSNIQGEQCPNTNLEPSSRRKACIRPQYLMYGQTKNNVIHSYYMVVSCSPDFVNHDDVISKCTSEQRDADNWLDLSLFIPVSSLHTKTTYKNMYCAMCNLEKQENIADWKLQVACSTEIPFIKPPSNQIELLTMIRQYKTCNIYFYDMLIDNSKCDWGQYTTCNQTGTWGHYDKVIDHGCNSYTSLYVGHYRNVFCFMCNQDEPPFMGCVPDDFKEDESSLFGTFTGLLRYRIEPNTYRLQQCRENEIYDTYEVCLIEINT